jgi:hypothetical protein
MIPPMDSTLGEINSDNILTTSLKIKEVGSSETWITTTSLLNVTAQKPTVCIFM